MKRIYLFVSLCMLVSFSFAQKKAVKDAKSAMGSNVKEARELIKPALTNPETKDDAETWKIAGDIEYKMFDDELTKTKTEAITKKKGDEPTMYEGLYNLYTPYLTADSLAQLPDEKGKVKNKYRKDIIKNFKEVYPYYINAGLFYNDQKDFAKASLFFEKYWDLPNQRIFEGEQDAFKIDTVYHTIKYYTILTSIQSENHPRAISLLKRIEKEPYLENSTYKESDIYELLASEYQRIDDSLSYVNALRIGAQKFPANKYFTPNLINEFIRGGKNAEALEFLDQAIANDPANSCDLNSVKATLYTDKKDYVTAEPLYLKAIESNSDCERALEGVGVLYILQAQDMKEKAAQAATRKEQLEIDKQTSDLYLKSIPYLEKYHDLLKARQAEPRDLKALLMKLQNVYYNLSLLKIDKATELEAIEKELNDL